VCSASPLINRTKLEAILKYLGTRTTGGSEDWLFVVRIQELLQIASTRSSSFEHSKLNNSHHLFIFTPGVGRIPSPTSGVNKVLLEDQWLALANFRSLGSSISSPPHFLVFAITSSRRSLRGRISEDAITIQIDLRQLGRNHPTDQTTGDGIISRLFTHARLEGLDNDKPWPFPR
jgi:hypothetical protein